MTRFHRHLFLGLCGILKSSFPKEALVLGFHLSPFLCRLFHQSDKKTWLQCLPKVLFTPGDRASVMGNRHMALLGTQYVTFLHFAFSDAILKCEQYQKVMAGYAKQWITSELTGKVCTQVAAVLCTWSSKNGVFTLVPSRGTALGYRFRASRVDTALSSIMLTCLTIRRT